HRLGRRALSAPEPPMSTRLLVATTNPHKLREIRALLSGADVELTSLEELHGVAEPQETGATFAENARLKALYYSDAWQRSGRGSVLVVAEDSGLVIDALDGEPGVRSARFLREDASYGERFEEIFRRLRARPGEPRS